jgi:8-hydroxy-5-deazaflavin:NADPH oxidoreductase
MTTVGLIGSGHIGSTVARLAIAAGHEAVLSNSRGPQTLLGLVAELGPRSRPATAEEAAAAGDIDGGALANGWRRLPGTPVYGAPYGTLDDVAR